MDLSNRDMKTMNFWRNILAMTAAIFFLVSCSSDPQWADEEAHEKTEQLQKQYITLHHHCFSIEFKNLSLL